MIKRLYDFNWNFKIQREAYPTSPPSHMGVHELVIILFHFFFFFLDKIAYKIHIMEQN